MKVKLRESVRKERGESPEDTEAEEGQREADREQLGGGRWPGPGEQFLRDRSGCLWLVLGRSLSLGKALVEVTVYFYENGLTACAEGALSIQALTVFSLRCPFLALPEMSNTEQLCCLLISLPSQGTIRR